MHNDRLSVPEGYGNSHPARELAASRIYLTSFNSDPSLVLGGKFSPDRDHSLQFVALLFGGRLLSSDLALPRIL